MRWFAQDTLNRVIISHHLQAVTKTKNGHLCRLYFLEARLSGEEEGPEKLSPVKPKIVTKGSETSTANVANANISSTYKPLTSDDSLV